MSAGEVASDSRIAEEKVAGDEHIRNIHFTLGVAGGECVAQSGRLDSRCDVVVCLLRILCLRLVDNLEELLDALGVNLLQLLEDIGPRFVVL